MAQYCVRNRTVERFIIRCNQMIKSVGMVWALWTVSCWHNAWLTLFLLFFFLCRLHRRYSTATADCDECVYRALSTHSTYIHISTLRGRNNNYQLWRYFNSTNDNLVLIDRSNNFDMTFCCRCHCCCFFHHCFRSVLIDAQYLFVHYLLVIIHCRERTAKEQASKQERLTIKRKRQWDKETQ